MCIRDRNTMFKKLTTHAIAEGDPCLKDQKDQKKGQKQKNRTPNAGEMVLAGGDPGGSCEAYPPADTTRLRAWNYDMIGHAEQCVIRWCELAHKEIKDIPTVANSVYRRPQPST